MENEKIVKFTTYKKINSEALIYGFPFTIFFILIVWLLVSGLIIASVPFNIKLLWGIITIAGVIAVFLIYQKYGLKSFLKLLELQFKNINVIKNNEPLIINKEPLKKNE